MKEFTTKIEEIEIHHENISKVEEFIIPKSKVNIEPFSIDEEEYLDYLIEKYKK
jgi:hypothetical protein